jgi:hypothetical protein
MVRESDTESPLVAEVEEPEAKVDQPHGKVVEPAAEAGSGDGKL